MFLYRLSYIYPYMCPYIYTHISICPIYIPYTLCIHILHTIHTHTIHIPYIYTPHPSSVYVYCARSMLMPLIRMLQHTYLLATSCFIPMIVSLDVMAYNSTSTILIALP